MFYYRATIAYDGSGFHGMAPQKYQRTVFEVLNEAINKAFGTTTYLKYAGRTDAGVHALGQVVTFHLPNKVAITHVIAAINGRLPDDLRVISVGRSDADFEPRHHAKSKVYRYVINTGPYDPFTCRYAYQLNRRLDLSAMKRAASFFLGQHDFLSFSSDEREMTVRTIDKIIISRRNKQVKVELIGRSFLRYMVRMVVAALVEIGLHKGSVQNIVNLLENPKKGSASHNAPACGLTLLKVSY